jgi:hypothetical protein
MVIAAQFAGGLGVADDVVHKDCVCRAYDRKYAQGEVLCLNGMLALCEMNLNNPSWKIISQTCPETHLNYSRLVMALHQAALLY